MAHSGGTERFQIAKWVFVGASIGLVVIALVTLVGAAVAGGEQFQDAARLVYSSLLPLLGTWVGTVLAYYFSKENFETASKSTRENLELALQQKLEALPIESNMRERSAIACIVIEPGQDERSIRLATMRGMLDPSVTRIPVFDDGDRVRCVVHGSLLYRFLVEAREKDPAFDPDAATLAQLLEHDDFERTLTALAFVAPSANVAQAKRAMELKNGCQDVFVTSNGDPTGRVVGWLTNTRIGRLAKA